MRYCYNFLNRLFLLVALLVLGSGLVQSQTINLTCGDNFYDPGGQFGNYPNNVNQTWTICGEQFAEIVTVEFLFFHTELNFDKLYVYDGPNTSSPLISSGSGPGSNLDCFFPGGFSGGPFFGANAIGPFTSTHPTGCLTFFFCSDAGGPSLPGWDAMVTCEPAPLCFVPTDLSISNVTGTSLLLSWESTGLEEHFDVQYGPVGSEFTNGTFVQGVTSPFQAINLTPNTEYGFYVRGVCYNEDDDVFDNSAWGGPATFQTVSCGLICDQDDIVVYSNATDCHSIVEMPAPQVIGNLVYSKQQLPPRLKGTGGICGGAAIIQDICDCPPGYVATGYTGEIGNGWGVCISSFSLQCRQINANGTLGALVTLTCSNGFALGTLPQVAVSAPAGEVLVGAQMRTGCSIDQLQGRSKNIFEVLTFQDNAQNTTMDFIGGGAGGAQPLQLVPNGHVIVGMQTYIEPNGLQNNPPGVTGGVAFRYANLSNVITNSASSCGLVSNSFNGTGNASGTYPIGSTEVTYNFTHYNTSQSECSFTVTVIDTTGPVMSCPDDIVVVIPFDETEGLAEVFISATDPCGIELYENSFNAGGADASGIYPLGTTVVEFTAVDSNGNVSTCLVNVIIEQMDPSMDCPDINANNGDTCMVNGDLGLIIDCECQIFDCEGVAGGSASIDDCGVCLEDGPDNPAWNTSCLDCFGIVGGSAIFDDCGVCRFPDDPDFNITCTDCNGILFGTAAIDDCGDCLEDGELNPAWNTSCADCAGVPNGTSEVDDCGDCLVDGELNPSWNTSCADCAGVPNGTSEVDDCGECLVDGPLNPSWNTSCVDCAGVPNGTSEIDECGDCLVDGPLNPSWNTSCADCAGVPNGTSAVDECGDCLVDGPLNPSWNTSCADCAGVPNGTSEVDDCGECLVDGPLNPSWNTSCADCAGVPNGTSAIDDCGVCLLGGELNPDWNTSCVDCAGVLFGEAFIDDCGVCVGGTTGLEPCIEDCFGILGGSAIFDDCGVCRFPGDPNFNATCTDCDGVLFGTAEIDECGECLVDGELNPSWNTSCADCAGVPNGTSEIDECGDCWVDGELNPNWNTSCADCAGVPNGTSAIDECGECLVEGALNPDWNTSCMDCAGIPNGTAAIDDCGVCLENGTANPDWNTSCMDCAGVPNGTSEIDDCGICLLGGDLNPEWNTSCVDCAGVLFGDAFIDNCGVCVGGTTGFTPCDEDCLGVPGGNAMVDDCGVCYEGGSNHPAWNTTCVDCAGVVNGNSQIDDCGVCLAGGSSNPDWNTSCIDCAGVVNGNAAIDDCGICLDNGVNNPFWNTACVDCAGVVNGTSEIDPCGDCILDGDSNPLWGMACEGDFGLITGYVITELGEGVVNTPVYGPNANALTNVAGFYSMYINQGASGTITANKDVDILNGLTTLDMVKIQQHILNIEYLQTPYQKIAADINANGFIEVGDVLTARAVIIMLHNEFLDPFTGQKVNTSWRMVLPGVVDPMPTSAIVPAFEEAYYLDSFMNDTSGFNFIGVKIGDVNNSAIGSQLQVDGSNAVSEFRASWHWEIDDRMLKAGDEFEFEVFSSQSLFIEGFQAQLQTHGIELHSIHSPVLPGWGSGSVNILGEERNRGLLSWSNPGTKITGGAPILTISGIAMKDGLLSELFELNKNGFRTEGYTPDLDLVSIHIHFQSASLPHHEADVLKVYPNPFGDKVQFNLYTECDEPIDLKVYDMTGKLVYQEQIMPVSGGLTFWTWQPDINVSAGVFQYSVRSCKVNQNGMLNYYRQ